jgi:hypothetical protein
LGTANSFANPPDPTFACLAYTQSKFQPKNSDPKFVEIKIFEEIAVVAPAICRNQ